MLFCDECGLRLRPPSSTDKVDAAPAGVDLRRETKTRFVCPRCALAMICLDGWDYAVLR